MQYEQVDEKKKKIPTLSLKDAISFLASSVPFALRVFAATVEKHVLRFRQSKHLRRLAPVPLERSFLPYPTLFSGLEERPGRSQESDCQLLSPSIAECSFAAKQLRKPFRDFLHSSVVPEDWEFVF